MEDSQLKSLCTGRDDTHADAATIAIVNCMASPSRFQTPSPQARTASSTVAPAPKILRRTAKAVRIMQMTHASGTHLSVKRDSLAPIFLKLDSI